MLGHFAWRQPVADKNTAIPVRIAAGYDYQEQFEYTGEQKLALLAPVPGETIDSVDESNDELINTESIDHSLNDEETDKTPVEISHINQSQNELGIDDIVEGETTSVSDSTETTSQDIAPILLPWVPEVDGSALVYIHRNYLHVDTALYYRKPGQQQVDVHTLPSLNSELLNITNPDALARVDTNTDTDTDTDVSLNQPNDINANNGNIISNEGLDLSGSMQQEDILSEFTWKYDDDFLNQDSQKLYTSRLFNYPLVQTRRMRSTELHYFDHPLIGMLVVIRPYELASSVTEADEE